MLATLADKAPDGNRWLHEIKFDGYRTQIILAGEEVRAYTRRGHDWTKCYRLILDAARELAEARGFSASRLLIPADGARPLGRAKDAYRREDLEWVTRKYTLWLQFPKPGAEQALS